MTHRGVYRILYANQHTNSMKKNIVMTLIALIVLSAVPSFAQWNNRRNNSYWNYESTRIRPRPVLRADEGLGVNDWYYGLYSPRPRFNTGWSQVLPPYVQYPNQDPYGYLRQYYNQPMYGDYRFQNQGSIGLLQPPGYYSPYRRQSGVTIILEAILNNRRRW